MIMLFEIFNGIKQGISKDFFEKKVPDTVVQNLNPALPLRDYQHEALGRLVHYQEDYPNRPPQTQLLFHMATGSGKTLIMAGAILYLYQQGYRNFIFFVNSTNIIEKTKDNFLNPLSRKFLFTETVSFADKRVQIREADNFEAVNSDDINILFTTVQGLHSRLNTPRENALTYEDFEDKEIVLISDEAHHINALTKKLHNQKLGVEELFEVDTWEGTVSRIFQSNVRNVMLEFTATAGLEDAAIQQKYQDKVIFQYSLKEFREAGYSKEVQVLQADLEPMDRALQAVILSQYRRKVAAKNGLHLKPVVLMKSRTIAESEAIAAEFSEKIKVLKAGDLQAIKKAARKGVLKEAFDYFKAEGITNSMLVQEIKADFAENKCLTVNSKSESEEKQLIVNSLEDYDNEYRVIFAVDKLNEGWDVLNLFDIVRLYDTRDAKGPKPGATTIREAQLIGRGARYFPFVLEEGQSRYLRKYDGDLNNPLRIIEELYYHSSHNPRYISELKTALVETGIMAPEDKVKEIELKIKEGFKKTLFWEVGKIYLNRRIENDRRGLFGLGDFEPFKGNYSYSLHTGQMTQTTVLDDKETKPAYINGDTKAVRLADFGDRLLRKALQRNRFFEYSNLRKYLPNLTGVSGFITSGDNLGNVKVEIFGLKESIENLPPKTKLHIAGQVLEQIRKEIQHGTTDYLGSKDFRPELINVIVKDKTLKLIVDETGDKQTGRPMSDPKDQDLFLNLKNKDWYVYEENYGTSEEKFFVKYIDSIIDKLKKEFAEIYLLRNAKLFQLYRFSDGKAFEPDYVMFLRKKRSKSFVVYQMFIEPKGDIYLKPDEWKEAFLLEIEKEYKIQVMTETEEYRLVGLPFYNKRGRQPQFETAFSKALEVEL